MTVKAICDGNTHVSAHGIDTVVLGPIDIVLVTEDANGHACFY
jgi:hypothetical protein